MITLQSLSLASLLVLGSGAAPDAVSPAVSATQATAATAIEVPGPGLQLDLYQTHGVITMPETPCGYQMLVMGTPGAHFEVQVLRTGDRPFVVGGGQLGEDGTLSLVMLPIFCEHDGEYVQARVVSFAEAPIAVKLEMF